jgi:hypothetical protein
MNDSTVTVLYIMMAMLPQVLTSAMGFVLCRKPAKNILSAVLNKKRRTPIAADVWDRANVKAGRVFYASGGLVCIVLSADFLRGGRFARLARERAPRSRLSYRTAFLSPFSPVRRSMRISTTRRRSKSSASRPKSSPNDNKGIPPRLFRRGIIMTIA